MNDTFCMDFFCSNKRKSFLQIKPHLIAKTTYRTCACTIMFLNARIKNMPKKIKVLLHGRKLRESSEPWAACSAL